jgi:hypothetical protein
MTKFAYINSNLERIKKEIRMGLISTTVLAHYVIYSRYDYYRKLGNYVGLSVLFASDCCNVCEKTVQRVIKEMEEICEYQ